MKIKDFKKFVNIDPEEVEVNAIELLEEHFFEDRNCTDYRNSAINVCNNKKIDWTSTENNTYQIFKRYIKIECPKCGREMEILNRGVNCNESYATYKCDTCGTQVNLTIPEKGFSVSFKK